MELRDLPDGWMTTRASLHAWCQAVTAFPRAAGDPDPRWGHVAMQPTGRGFAAATVTLADGRALASRIDLVDHAIVATAGDDILTFPLSDGPAPHDIGVALAGLASRHGSVIEADPERYGDTGAQPYDEGHAAAFLDAANAAVAAMNEVNADVSGEVTGPHLWPHGFDIATEWYSELLVEDNGSPANAQIALGWYPAERSYVYANPWPFEDQFADVALPHGAVWHRSGWEGAKLDVPKDGAVHASAVVDVARAVHEATRPALSR